MFRPTSTLLAFLCAASFACGDDAATPDTSIVFEAPDSNVAGDAGADADAADGAATPGGPSCTVDEECPEDAPICVADEAGRAGYCSMFCLPGPPSEDPCPEGTHCTPLGFMRGYCLPECDPALEHPCREGFGCAERAPAANVCAPGCDADSDCPDGLECNRSDGTIGEGECYTPGAALTDPCTEPEECNSDSWCIRERDRGWPGGACTVFRCDEVEDTGCPGDAHCVFDFYRDPICVDGCETDDDCRTGYACEPDETYPDRIRCTPRCREDSECLEPGFRCDVDSGRCV